MFGTIHLRKKCLKISGISALDSGLLHFVMDVMNGSFVVKYIFEIYHTIDFRAFGLFVHSYIYNTYIS